ncbi:MAG: helix-turn-helix domain-containing protein [Burkholderiaceae bacterium]
MLTIGQLARRTGVKVPTIRYYEQVGLIVAGARTEGNQRRYTGAALERLSFIRHARDLGLPIEAIRELLELAEHPQTPCRDAHRIAAGQLAAVRARIDRLRRLETALLRMTAGDDSGEAGDCQVLRALADHARVDHAAPDHPGAPGAGL